MPAQTIANLFKLVVKALKFTIARPLQRFHIEGRAKKYLGEESKYFMPAPRAIGALTQRGVSQYPHLENMGKFKSVAQRRQEAIASRNQKLLEESSTTTEKSISQIEEEKTATQKSFSEIKQDDDLVIEASINRLPVIRTVPMVEQSHSKSLSASDDDDDNIKTKVDTQLVKSKSHRPLPKLVNMQLSDPAVIWQVDRVPPGRLDLNKLQELMINKLADDAHWTAKEISKVYNIKEEYAEYLISYLKQIRIIISPHIKKCLDLTALNDPTYQATKDIIYQVDYTLRSIKHRAFDETFLPTDQLDEEVRKVLEGGVVAEQSNPKSKLMQPDIRLTKLYRRPEPLKLNHSINNEKPKLELTSNSELSSTKQQQQQQRRRKLATVSNQVNNRPAAPLLSQGNVDEEKKRD